MQVPNHEVFALVDGEEFAHASSELNISQLKTFGLGFNGSLFISCNGRWWCIILEVEIAPFNLDYWVLASMIPDCQWSCVTVMVETIVIRLYYQNAYPIEPHVKPTKRYPLSDIEREEGDPRPEVSS